MCFFHTCAYLTYYVIITYNVLISHMCFFISLRAYSHMCLFHICDNFTYVPLRQFQCAYFTCVLISHMCFFRFCAFFTYVLISLTSLFHICAYITYVLLSHICLFHICVYFTCVNFTYGTILHMCPFHIEYFNNNFFSLDLPTPFPDGNDDLRSPSNS